MNLSAIICTLNRSDLLREAVESLVSQTLPASTCEIIVVDNGSIDATKEVVEALARQTSNVGYVYEPRTGLSNARNRGVREAKGEVVAFMDDDAVASPRWAEELWDVYQSDPSTGAVGGRVELTWPTQRPTWLPESMEAYYGKLDLGSERSRINYPVYPYGLNMSMRRKLLLELGGFSTRLGRKGRNLISGEETDVFYRMSCRDVKVVYEPRAVVHHRVDKERLSRRWLLRRLVAEGRSRVIFQRLRDDQDGRLISLRSFPRAASRAALYGCRSLYLLATGRAGTSRFVHNWAQTAYFASCAVWSVHAALERRSSPASRVSAEPNSRIPPRAAAPGNRDDA